MADPGERFEATDVITDPNLPRRRLIFAGVSQDRAFVHYEEGGIAQSYIVELFRLEPSGTAVGIWHGYFGPAKSLDEIRQLRRWETTSAQVTGNGVYQELPRIFSVLRVDSTSPRSTYG
jgi:hypothetical protein